MRLFLDSSALVKRYVEEPGSARVIELCRQADEIVISVVGPIEIFSALARRRREGYLSSPVFASIKRNIAADIAGASIVELYPQVVAEAVKCLEKSPLRSLDAIQVASAIVCESDLFLTADKRQALGAKKRRLRTELVS